MFIVVIAVGGFIIAWYVLNEIAGAGGRRGLLGLRDEGETDAAQGKRWRRRAARLAPQRLTGAESALAEREEAAEAGAPAFRAARRGLWRDKDAPGYRPKPPRGGEPPNE